MVALQGMVTMTTLRRTAASFALAPFIALALVTTGCGSSGSPTAPTSPSAVAGVALTPSTVAAGSSVGGVVSLSSVAPSGGASVALVSSNTSVATVPAVVMVLEGASSAAFTVATSAPGTSSISAAMGGVSAAATLTVTSIAALSTLALSTNSVVGGDSVVGTVTLTDAAGPGGAAVLLSAADPVSLPASVTVLSGQRSASFAVSTRPVGGTIVANIRASYAGASAAAILSVTPPASANAAVAGFGISGTTVTDTCVLTNNGNNLECTFDGSLSTAPGRIVAWEWSYTVFTTITQTTTGPVLNLPVANCGFLPPPPLPEGQSSYRLTVTLRNRDSLGNVSAVASDDGARVLPNGLCGF